MQERHGFDLGHTTYLVLAGERALWTLQESGNNTYVQLVTGALSAKADVQLEELVFSNALGDGDHVGGLAGDGSTLLFGVVEVGVEGPPGCDVQGTCRTVVSDGALMRVRGTSVLRVPKAPSPAALVASGRRVALAVAGIGGLRIRPAVEPRVEVRDVVTGKLIGALTPGGRPINALALSPSFVAVLTTVPTSRGPAKRIEQYTHAGSLLRVASVPARTAPVLSATATRIVLRVGRSIRMLHLASGRVTKLATAKATPIGLSIEGRRVAWAENLTLGGKLRGRIQVILL